MITVVIVVVMTVRWRSRTPLLLLAIGTAGSLLMTAVGKELVGRARPPVADAVPPYETSPAFPSGHALNNTVVACLVGYLLLLHLTSLLWRRAPGPVSGQLSSNDGLEEPSKVVLVSCRLSPAGIRFLDILFPPKNSAPLPVGPPTVTGRSPG